MEKRVVEAAGREVERGQIVMGLRGHSKEVSFTQSAAGGQRGFKPGSGLIQFVFYKDRLLFSVEH